MERDKALMMQTLTFWLCRRCFKDKNILMIGLENILQATLGGKLKGNSVQYHNNIKPDEGETLYNLFCDELTRQSEGVGGEVKRGIWGARQVVSMETNGPYSHIFDI